MSLNNEKPARKIWTKEEKKKLLNVIKVEGHTNYDKIAQYFPNKSAYAIKAKVNKYLVLSKSIHPGAVDPLDFWMYSYFTLDSDSLISKALLYIRLFENHPPTDETNGVELDTIYGFLHRLTLGHPPNNISAESWKAFETEMQKATEYVTSRSEKEVLTHLSTLSTKTKPANYYEKNKTII